MTVGQQSIATMERLIENAEAGNESAINLLRRIAVKASGAAPPDALIKIAKCLRDIRLDEYIDESLMNGSSAE